MRISSITAAGTELVGHRRVQPVTAVHGDPVRSSLQTPPDQQGIIVTLTADQRTQQGMDRLRHMALTYSAFTKLTP